MKTIFALALAGLAAFADAKDGRTFAVLHFNGKQLTKGRMDPIISPGKVSSHVHTVMGASNFGLGATGQSLKGSKCSNAMVKGDFSAYWFPSLYFHDEKANTFEAVELFYVNAYYFFEGTDDQIKAFPTGLQIVSGDAMTRSPPPTSETNLDPSKGPVQPIKWTCPRQNFDPPNWPANSDGKMAGMGDPHNKGEGVGFPDMNCDGYASPLRADIHFPSCYNPKAGLTNYKENMVFPSDHNGKQNCPAGYIHVPHLFLEVYWNTPKFVDRWTQGQGKQPFVLANGDATGYSDHADFMAGWDEELLQHIIDTCDTGTGGMDKCPGLKYGLNEGDCTIPSAVNEQVDGVMSKLPGNNPLSGWQYGNNVPSMGSNSGNSGSSGGGSGGDSGSSNSSGAGNGGNGGNGSGSKAPSSSPSNAATTKPAPSSKPPTVVINPQTTTEQKPASGTAPAGTCNGGAKTITETVTVTAGAAGSGPTAEGTDDGSSSANSTAIAGFRYAGCFKDTGARVLQGELRPNLGAMDNAKCITHCRTGKFALAGTEYGGQCYCGNELAGSEKLDDGKCNVKCEGDKSSVCGGDWALSVYSADGEASLKGAKSKRVAHEHVHLHRSGRH